MQSKLIILIFSLIIGSWPTPVVAEKVTFKELELVNDYLKHCFGLHFIPGLAPKKPGWITEKCASNLSPAHDGVMLNKKHILEVWENLGGPEATSGKVREHRVKGKRQWWRLGEEKLTELATTYFSLVKAGKLSPDGKGNEKTWSGSTWLLGSKTAFPPYRIMAFSLAPLEKCQAKEASVVKELATKLSVITNHRAGYDQRFIKSYEASTVFISKVDTQFCEKLKSVLKPVLAHLWEVETLRIKKVPKIDHMCGPPHPNMVHLSGPPPRWLATFDPMMNLHTKTSNLLLNTKLRNSYRSKYSLTKTSPMNRYDQECFNFVLSWYKKNTVTVNEMKYKNYIKKKQKERAIKNEQTFK